MAQNETHPAPQAQQRPAPIERQQPPQRQQPFVQQQQHGGGQAPRPGPFGQPNEHLSQWMQSHSNLPLAQQQNALQQEPGFRQLQPQVQQRMHDRLTQLNNMQPEQRQRVLQRTEAMERLQPVQRQQVRDAYAQLGGLPMDRRRMVARTFNYVRTLPPDQRQSYLNSPQVRGQFSDNERGTLNNLLNAPYIPPISAPPQAPPDNYPH